MSADLRYQQASRQVADWITHELADFWTVLKRRWQAQDEAAAGYSTHQAGLESLEILARAGQAWQQRLHAALEDAALAWRSPQQVHAKCSGQSLSLMSEAELSVQLHAQKTVASVHKQLEKPLLAMERQLAALASQLGLGANAENPWGVAAVVDAFTQALPLNDCSPALLPMVFEQLEARLPQIFAVLLPKLEPLLKDLPASLPAALAAAPGNLQSHAQPQPETGWVPDGGLVEPVASENTDMPFAAGGKAAFRDVAVAPPPIAGEAGYRQRLRASVAQWRHRHPQQAQRQAQFTPGNARIFQTSEVLAVASMLQGEDPAPFVDALAAGAANSLQGTIREQMLQAAAQLGFDPAKTRFAQDEDDAIELVAMLFEHLVRAHGLPRRGMQMFAKLVLPYVKMVVMDDSLFSSQSHPARHLLDALTEACEGNDGHDPFGRELLDRAEHLVDEVVARFQKDQAVFEASAQALRSLLKQQRQRMEIAEKRLAETLYGRERLKFAQDVAYQALLERMGKQPMSDGVWAFMQGYWRNGVMQIWLRHGAQSQHYRNLLALGDALPKLDAAGAALRTDELAQGFTEQLPVLHECVAQSGLLGEAADEAIARLLQAMVNVDAERHARTPPAAPEDAQDDSQAAMFAAEADPTLVLRLRKLKPGQRLRLRESDGRESPCKLAWISPLSSRLLIVNRSGTQHLWVSAEALACKIQAGEVTLCASEAPMEQAIRNLWEQLQPAAVA
ncbi:MAG: DUF1631 family protein [Pseudomonadota bacterium]|nr:DUF1631 family protein [Pseudomonadota bacterium]